MIVNPKAHADLARLVRHISSQLALGRSMDEAINLLKDKVDENDVSKVEFIASLLKGETRESAALSPYKVGLYATLSKLIAVVGKHDGQMVNLFEHLNEALSITQNNVKNLWKGLNGLLVYVFSVGVIATVCLSIYTVKVAPQFEDLYSNFGASLPEFTLTVFQFTEFLSDWWLLIFPIVGLVLLQLFRLGNKIHSFEPLDKSFSMLPGTRSLYKLHFRYVFIGYAYLIYKGGVDSHTAINESLVLMGRSEDGLALLENDSSLTDVNIALQTGTLGPELEYQFQNLESDYLGALAALREKITIVSQVFLALIVGAIVIAMYLPIFSLGQVM